MGARVTVELLLNLIWLLMAVASFAWWRRRFLGAGRERSRGRMTLGPVVALACALAVIFPVISVTDDLHAELAVMEDSSSWRRSVSSVCASHEPAARWKHFTPPAVMMTPIEASISHVVASVRLDDSCRRIETPLLVLADRSPPSL